MTKVRKEFLEGCLGYCDYWQGKDNATYGAVFSILAMMDGCSSANNFNRIELKGISNEDELHEDFCKLRRERDEK